MIFDHGTDVFESEKERNLYYKVFAGYLFNEYIDGLAARIALACSWINETPVRGQAAADVAVTLDAATTHVSFDNHAYLFGRYGVDRGEFADILIHDRAAGIIVTIEAKVHSDWSYAKDIAANDARLGPIQSQMTNTTFVPCLLVAKSKWSEAERMQNHPRSNYRQFFERDDNRFRVLFWEDLAALVAEPQVKVLIEHVLAHPPNSAIYSFDGGWFYRPFSGSLSNTR